MSLRPILLAAGGTGGHLFPAAALAQELEREQGRPSLVDLGVQFCRDLRAKGRPAGRPADKAFRDSLYEDA